MEELADLSDCSWYDADDDEVADLRPRAELEAAAAWCRADYADEGREFHRGTTAALAWLLGQTGVSPTTGRRYPPLYGPVGWEATDAGEYCRGWWNEQPVRPVPSRVEYMNGVEMALLWAVADNDAVPWDEVGDRPGEDEPVVA